MYASLFPTELGWFALVGAKNVVHRLTIGHPDAEAAWETVLADAVFDGEEQPEQFDWYPKLRYRLEAFARGEETDFSDVKIASKPGSDFQSRVVKATRRLGYGETASYGELAARVGSPRAARAVGRVMATNRVPIIVPCHRVLAANGRLGGFSAPTGTDLKHEMLSREAAVATSS